MEEKYNIQLQNTLDYQAQLINLLTTQIVDLTLMSKIELGNDVIDEINRLKTLINQHNNFIALVNLINYEAGIKKSRIGKFIEELGSEYCDVFCDLFDKIGDCNIVRSTGGGEGGGEYVERIIHFKNYNCYVRITGFYTSYNGTDWHSDFIQVEPYERVITDYKSI